MFQEESKRQRKLYTIAQEDPIYQLWSRSFEECRESFVRFAATQPEDIRSVLFGYAECGRMAQQRLVNLACENMVFPEDQ